MNADRRGLKHKELTETIIGVFFEVYNELGHGFLESVYENAFDLTLTARGLDVRRQIEVPVWFRDRKVGDFVADMLVERFVLLELKAVRTLDSSHEAQGSTTFARPKSRLACCSTSASNLSSRGSRTITHESGSSRLARFRLRRFSNPGTKSSTFVVLPSCFFKDLIREYPR